MSLLKRLTMSLLALLPATTSVMAAEVAEQTFDLGIESMRSHGYSVFIFVFLMVGIAVFLGIIAVYARTGQGAALKTGEKVLLIMIVLGVFASIAFAALQLLDGFLF
ncbi:MAG: hypothetical protein COW18_05585 [Zetaproteobacteria bacterium CG12_big_fil_rev_8_21_14_0_65_54_13]|nr:MAG: hypothetical protein COW18_05585 [Zetaproteobacteria bacterium CG12_big_fil_rev_8_21_14_0_65_54_13]PIX55176.1 MAG: hypothetical protein COZ50_04125 [Zetaproteobacteria bacterium CG_4_10_14_3_um_filter_54_28]PJA28481.1 MAG: hypothetical protein CO188_09430 [Zetaproteobacteria bacterium CG_4_9_14_3_um_filter_54_145]